MCCRKGAFAESSPNVTLQPAPRFGSFVWYGQLDCVNWKRVGLIILYLSSDTPFSLAAAVFQAIPVLAGTQDTGFDFSIYTGDLVSHDPDNEIDREYVLYTEAGLQSPNGNLI